MSVDVAVVPVAGLGTRLLPLTCSVPKELLPLGRKPVLQHVVEELSAAGIRQIVLVTGVGESSIKAHFDVDQNLERQLLAKDKSRQLSDLQATARNVSITYVNQAQQLGLGHAIGCARDIVGNRPFAIALGDAMFGTGYASPDQPRSGQVSLSKRLLDVFERTSADAVIAFEEVAATQVNRYGIAQTGAMNIDGEGSFELIDLIEKPALENAPSRYAIAARYVCRGEIFDLLDNTTAGVGGEIQLTDALRTLIHSGGKVIGVPLAHDEKRFDVGNFDSYFSAFVEIACADPDYGDSLKQRLKHLLGKDDDASHS